jgi:hypothetical protein
MIWCLRHHVENSILSPNDTVALEFGTRINASHKSLIVRLLIVSQFDVKDAELIALGFGFAALTELASLSRGTRHKRYASCINHC